MKLPTQNRSGPCAVQACRISVRRLNHTGVGDSANWKLCDFEKGGVASLGQKPSDHVSKTGKEEELA